MVAILSPAKTLDFKTNYNNSNYTIPDYIEDSEVLSDELKKINEDDLSTLMSLSPALSKLNFQRYQDWNSDFNLLNSRQSILCFKGGVYVGLDIDSFSEEDLLYSQDNLRVLSGLHGVLKPLDLIKPYRLEMGTKLKTQRGKNLYEFWGNKITHALNVAIQKSSSKFLLNLASNEYFSSINSSNINADIVDVKFLDKKKDVYKTISFFAKKARGAMAAFMLKNKIKDINNLKSFSGLGYLYDSDRSTKNLLVFIR